MQKTDNVVSILMFMMVIYRAKLQAYPVVVYQDLHTSVSKVSLAMVYDT